MNPPYGVAPETSGEPAKSEHAEHNAAPFELPEPATLSSGRAVVIAVGVAVILGGAFLMAYVPRMHAREELEASAKTAGRGAFRVDVVKPKTMSSDRAMMLPGSVKPLQETTIYSRADGYLKRWLVDIGDKVKEGQVLAEVETPELDQQLLQARAQLAQAQAGVTQAVANRDFSKSNYERYKNLGTESLASQQDIDQKRAQAEVDEASVSVANANVIAMKANIDRLMQLKAFSRVTAPFAGTITSRTVDVGALVTAGSSTPLFQLVELDPMRVFVQVPQDVAPSVKNDVPAEITVREYPGKVFKGKVARSAGALDPSSRTMTTELRVPNPDGALFAGMYAEVAFTLPSPHRVLELPATALVSDARGLRVQVVEADDTVHSKTVAIERDTGTSVLVSSGLTGDERVVRIASAELQDGTPVEILPPPAAPAAAPSGPAGK